MAEKKKPPKKSPAKKKSPKSTEEVEYGAWDKYEGLDREDREAIKSEGRAEKADLYPIPKNFNIEEGSD